MKDGKFPFSTIVWTTSIWLLVLLIIFVVASYGAQVLTYAQYRLVRAFGSVILPILAVSSLVIAARRVYRVDDSPWYHNGPLICFTLFWAIFPPVWFFVEYLSIDNGAIALPSSSEAEAIGLILDGKTSLKSQLLLQTKTYADMAAKIWGATGAMLAAFVAFAPRK